MMTSVLMNDFKANELAVGKGKKPHTHIRMYLKNGNNTEVIHEVNDVVHHMPSSVHTDFFNNLPYVITQSNTSYRFDEDGATEYYKTTATVRDDDKRIYHLRIDIFSCYCEPLNENQEPPF